MSTEKPRAASARTRTVKGISVRFLPRRINVGAALIVARPAPRAWAVITLTDSAQPEAPAGTYAGLGADLAARLGFGANVLIGGMGRAFSLQPLSIEGEVGINISGRSDGAYPCSLR